MSEGRATEPLRSSGHNNHCGGNIKSSTSRKVYERGIPSVIYGGNSWSGLNQGNLKGAKTANGPGLCPTLVEQHTLTLVIYFEIVILYGSIFEPDMNCSVGRIEIPAKPVHRTRVIWHLHLRPCGWRGCYNLQFVKTKGYEYKAVADKVNVTSISMGSDVGVSLVPNIKIYGIQKDVLTGGTQILEKGNIPVDRTLGPFFHTLSSSKYCEALHHIITIPSGNIRPSWYQINQHIVPWRSIDKVGQVYMHHRGGHGVCRRGYHQILNIKNGYYGGIKPHICPKWPT